MNEYQNQVVGGALPPENNNKNGKALASKILGFIAAALSIISIPMLFLPICSAVLLGSFNIVQLKDIADFVGLSSYFVGVLIYFIVVMLFSAVAGVLNIFKKRACKIVAFIIGGIALILSIVAIVLIYVKGESLVKPDIGIWLNTALLLVAFVLSLVAFITAPKKATNEVIDPVYFPQNYLQSDGGGTDVLEGKLVFTSGSCAGYEVPVRSGARIVIGKDPSKCSIVIDKSYSKVSRAHCSVEYDSMQDIYIVTDLSTNGTTVVGGAKLQSGSPSYLQRGTVINLAGTDNTFRLD